MSLLDDIHRRVDQLSAEQLNRLREWFDHQAPGTAEQELTELAQASREHAARSWPNDDWSGTYQQWKAAQERQDEAG